MGETKDKLKGKAKEIAGTVTGNRRMQAEGIGLQVRGVVRGAAKDLKRKLKLSVKRTARPRSTEEPSRATRSSSTASRARRP